MSIFRKLFGTDSIEEKKKKMASAYYLEDIDRMLQEISGHEQKIDAVRSVIQLFQETFAHKFGTMADYLAHSGSVRHEYLETLSKILNSFYEQGKEVEAIALTIFTIQISVAELGDKELQRCIDRKLINFFM